MNAPFFRAVASSVHGAVDPAALRAEGVDPAALTDFSSNQSPLGAAPVVAAAVASSEIVEAAWERGAELAVHGWIYDLKDGLIRDLEVTVGTVEESAGA